MHIGRPVLSVFGGALFGAVIAVSGPQVPALLDRPSCAETVMKAVSTDKPVTGTLACFNKHYQTNLKTVGVDSDSAFATKIGNRGQYRYVRKTDDNGYVYEFDKPMSPHDSVRGAISAMGVPKIWSDVRRGDIAAAWSEVNDFRAAWKEITGQTQGARSSIFVFYLDPDGKINTVK